MGHWSKTKYKNHPDRIRLRPHYALAAVSAIGVMTYAIIQDGKKRALKLREQIAERAAEDADLSMPERRGMSMTASAASVAADEYLTTDSAAATASTSSVAATASTSSLAAAAFSDSASIFSGPSSGLSSGVSADNVPSYVLANSGLDNEQKLMVALCRRQAWVRAAQGGPLFALWTYAGVVLYEAVGPKLPKGTRLAAPLTAAVVGSTLGAYYGGLEGKPFMQASLMARKVEHAHKKRSERPPEEDAFKVFLRDASKGQATQRERDNAQVRQQS